MRISIRSTLAAAGLGLATLAVTPANAEVVRQGGIPWPDPACDRECLIGVMDAYLDAMVDQDADNDMFARFVRFTENGIEFPLGNEGLWASAAARGNYKFYVADEQTQTITYMGTMMEEARAGSTASDALVQPIGVDVRLKLNDEGKVSEIEQIVARPDRPLIGEAPPSPFGDLGTNVEAMGAPHPIFNEIIPEDERMSREDLVAVTNHYFEAMQRNDGQGYYPFTDDCLRHENGSISAGPQGAPGVGPNTMGCKQQFEESLLGVVTGIRDRRVVAVDPERGLTYAFAFFDHRPINWTWQLGEIFKIENNQIRRIEAIFIRGPYGMCSGWSTYEQCRSEEVQDVR